VDVKLMSTAAVRPPRGEPTVSQFLRLCGPPHNRKNYLFFGSDVGGETAAVLYTFTQTCQALGIEPWRYLRDVLQRLPSQPVERLAELLPDEWALAQRRVTEAMALAEPSAITPPPSG
jgi:transposase